MITRNCGSCRYWSELVARKEGAGPLEALCLSQLGPLGGQYTREAQACGSWARNTAGAIDCPELDDEHYPAETQKSGQKFAPQ